MRIMIWITVAATAVLSGCTQSPDTMARLMKQEGITEWKDVGYVAFKCGKDDSFSSGFEGKKNGQPVSGTVCSGFMKGYTIRYN